MLMPSLMPILMKSFIFQAEELNSIVGHAFRLAYSAHLEKSAADLPSRDFAKRSRQRSGRLSSRPRKHRLKTNLDDISSSSSQDKCESHFSYHSSVSFAIVLVMLIMKYL